MYRFSVFVLSACLAGLARAAVPADAVLSDFPRLKGETDDAARAWK